MPDAPALSVHATPVFARVPAGPRALEVVVELAADDLPLERRRPKLSVCLSLDVSGSMAGPPLEQVARSVEKILTLLREDDEVAVVAFSTRATLVSPRSPLDAAARRAIASRVARLYADDRTNVEAGLRLAAEQLMPVPGEGTRNAIVLLSDGEPNEGAVGLPELSGVARSLRERASISTLGYGLRHDDKVLLAVADAGGGAYRFIADPATCQLELAQAVGTQGDVAVSGIEIVLVPAPGVEITRVAGAAQPRFSHDGLVVSAPDMAAATARTLVVEVKTTFDASRALGRLFDLQVRHRRAGSARVETSTSDARVDIGGQEAVADGPALGKALLVRADDVRAAARAMADRSQFDGAAAMLRALMSEIAAVPGYVQGDGSALSEAWEQLLDEAMAMERRPTREALSMLKGGTSTKSFSMTDGLRASSRPLGRLANRMTASLAGPVSGTAALVVVRGPNAGLRMALGTQNTIGRTPSADVHLPSSQVSRRHADVFVLEGDYFLADLGSTNVTAVNGKRIERAPQALKHGDLVQIGDVELRFERAAR